MPGNSSCWLRLCRQNNTDISQKQHPVSFQDVAFVYMSVHIAGGPETIAEKLIQRSEAPVAIN
jgi:hypothetical protein